MCFISSRSNDAYLRNGDPYFFFSPQNSLDIRAQQIELSQQFVVRIGVILIDENIGEDDLHSIAHDMHIGQ